MPKCLLVCGAALLIGWVPVDAQSPDRDPAGLHLTRPDLQQMLERFENIEADARSSQASREKAGAEAQLVRQRLLEGDLRPGDRIALMVDGFAELTDTFSVGANRSIVLPQIGELPVAGVLRSELQSHLTEHISRFINNPVVHAGSLIRLQVLGAVTRPGFYSVGSDVLIGDALMAAGGPLATADLDEITIERADEEIWSGEQMREAVVAGRTLDQLSIRAGDRLIVPEQRGSRFDRFRDIALVASGLVTTVVLLVQVFGR